MSSESNARRAFLDADREVKRAVDEIMERNLICSESVTEILRPLKERLAFLEYAYQELVEIQVAAESFNSGLTVLGKLKVGKDKSKAKKAK